MTRRRVELTDKERSIVEALLLIKMRGVLLAGDRRVLSRNALDNMGRPALCSTLA